MVVVAQEQAARYKLRYPNAANYGAIAVDRLNELGDFVESIKGECPADEWFDEAIKRAKPKRHVAHDCFTYDAEAALCRAQRDQARMLFSQFIPVHHVEELDRDFELPPASPTIRLRDHDSEVEADGTGDGGEPIYKRGQVDWFSACDDPELRDELMREGVKHIKGYIPWIRDFDEMQFLVKAIRKAERLVGLVD